MVVAGRAYIQVCPDEALQPAGGKWNRFSLVGWATSWRLCWKKSSIGSSPKIRCETSLSKSEGVERLDTSSVGGVNQLFYTGRRIRRIKESDDI